MLSSTRDRVDWHAASIVDVFANLVATDAGLTGAEAQHRLTSFGPNELPRQPMPAWWEILIRQFFSPLIYVLVFAAVLSITIGDMTDAGFIAFVLTLNAGIGG